MVFIDIEQLACLFYGGTYPGNIKLYFLKEEEYGQKYKELTKKLYGKMDNDYRGSFAYCIYDSKNNEYHILLKDYEGDYYDAYAMTLFHELAHVETMPQKLGAALLCSSKKKDENALSGYMFWREYIAQYEAVNRYMFTIGSISFLDDKDETKDIILKMLKSADTLLYEIILYSEIAGVYIDGAEQEMRELEETLQKIRRRFNSREELKNITKKELSNIGICVNKVYDAINK